LLLKKVVFGNGLVLILVHIHTILNLWLGVAVLFSIVFQRNDVLMKIRVTTERELDDRLFEYYVLGMKASYSFICDRHIEILRDKGFVEIEHDNAITKIEILSIYDSENKILYTETFNA